MTVRINDYFNQGLISLIIIPVDGQTHQAHKCNNPSSSTRGFCARGGIKWRTASTDASLSGICQASGNAVSNK